MAREKKIEAYDRICAELERHVFMAWMRQPRKKLEKALREHFGLSYYMSKEVAFLMQN